MMRSLLFAVIILLLAGCDDSPSSPSSPVPTEGTENPIGLDGGSSLETLFSSTWTDPSTGCAYIAISERVASRYILRALAPKFSRNGESDCEHRL